MPLSMGDRLGPYEILAAIGAGGMGEVYRARDTRLDRIVAIKVSKAQFSERFEREARAVAALNHPNICHLYDVGPNYLVMEFVEGEPLQGPLPLDTALNYFRQVADALDAAHEKGIVHRDLKPGNILITRDGVVKVLDFGLAKTGGIAGNPTADSPTFTMSSTQAGMILGTAAYMSPEQARGLDVDKRADIWALGVVLFELLNGEQLFGGATVSDTLASVLKEEPRWERIPARAQPLLRRCLEKDPKKRLRDIGDAAALLDIPTPASSQPSVKQARVRYGIALGAAALFAIAFGVVSFTHFREGRPAAGDPVRFQITLPDKVNFTATGSFSLSPDGKHLAFSALGADDHPGVWIHDMNSLGARRLPDADTGSLAPPFFWSPDSRFVVFSDGSSKLRKSDISSGAVETICDLPSPPIGGSFNQDGVIIFGNSRGGMWKVPVSGGKAQALTALDASRNERSHELPTFLPDGRHFLYLRSSTVADYSGVYLGSIDTKPDQQSSKLIVATRVGAAYVPASATVPAQLLFLREGRVLAQAFDDRRLELVGDPAPVAEGVGTIFNTGYFSVSANGVLIYRTGNGDLSQLAWVDRQGVVGPALTEAGPYIAAAVAPDGVRAVAVRTDLANSGLLDLWMLDFARGTSARFTFDPGRSLSPVWSPDGKQIAFQSGQVGRSTAMNIYQKLADGSKEEQLLLKSDADKSPSSWSHDGRFLLYTTSGANTKADIWVLPLEGSRKPYLSLGTPANERDAAFSPDGRWVAYSSDESGRSEIYVRAFSQEGASSGGKWMVSKDSGRFPWWRPDGKELLFYDSGSRTSMSVEVTSSPVFQSGPPKVAFRNLPGTVTPDYSPDGQRALVAVPVRNDANAQLFNVVLNWTSLLKRK